VFDDDIDVMCPNAALLGERWVIFVR